jgi:chromosome segregation ATPase
MDDRRTISSQPDRPADTVVRQLRDKRQRFHDLLMTQRDQLALLERAIEEQLEHLQAAVAEQPNVATATDLAELEAKRFALAAEAESLAKLSSELDRRESELVEFEIRLKTQEQSVVEQLARQQAELDERAADLHAAGQQIRQAQRALAASEEELASDREQVARLRERLQEQVHAVEQERENLSVRRSDTNTQRRRIARELHNQRQAQKAEIAGEREALRVNREALKAEREHHREEYEQRLADLNRRSEELRQMAVAGDGQLREQLEGAQADASELRRQLNEHKHILNARAQELTTIRAEHAAALAKLETLETDQGDLREELANRQANDGNESAEIKRLRDEIDSLRAQLATAESRPASTEVSEEETRKREDMKRRFELAVEDLRDVKRRNSDLEEQLAVARAGQAMADVGSGVVKLDWEAQKRKLLASLEADEDDDDDEHDREERLRIQSTIRITDEIVARKDQEIMELKRVLDDQSSNLGSVAVGASAIAEMFDQDELILQERENLARIQAEWRDKLRQAEIDISVERARMARERIELDEKLQSLQAEKDKFGDPSKGEASNPNQRRWWTRLGLKEQE